MQATFPGVEFLRFLFSFKKRKKNSSSYVHVLRRFHVVVVQWTWKKCTKERDARAELLFWSLNLLFFWSCHRRRRRRRRSCLLRINHLAEDHIMQKMMLPWQQHEPSSIRHFAYFDHCWVDKKRVERHIILRIRIWNCCKGVRALARALTLKTYS